MHVKIIETNDRLGVKAGEIYEASRYPYDECKYTLEARVPDGFDPCCNMYSHNIQILHDYKLPRSRKKR